MGLRINDTAPDFTALTTHGEMGFHDWLGNDWGVLFSHPKDLPLSAQPNLVLLPGWRASLPVAVKVIAFRSIRPTTMRAGSAISRM